jgi:lipopolysaccharide export system permease protein
MRLLFITSNRLGDAILSTGVLAHYLRAYPGCEVSVICGPIPAPLFRAVPGISEVIAVEKQKFALHWLMPFAHLLGRRWDVMVDLRNVAIMRLLPARTRVFGDVASGKRHRLEDFAELVGTPGDVPAPTLWLDEAANAKAAALIPDGAPVIAVAPVTGPMRKLWRPERYAAVLDALMAPAGRMPDARVAVFAAPNEADRANELIKLLPAGRTLDLVGATDPLEAAAAIGRCAFFLGVDSGLMHAAAAMNVPIVGLFGEHGVPQIYRPWGRFTAYVHRRNPHWNPDDKPSAMDAILVEEVIKVCEALIERTRHPESSVAGRE